MFKELLSISARVSCMPLCVTQMSFNSFLCSALQSPCLNLDVETLLLFTFVPESNFPISVFAMVTDHT